MGRDYTKYNVSGLGENLNKRQLVFEIVKDYVEKKKPSFDELTAVFKDEIQGSKGFIKKAVKVKDAKRFNTKTPLKIKFGVEVVVSNQWGKDNLAVFIDHVKGLGYKVESVSGEVSTDQNSASGSVSEVTKTPEISDEIKALINEAGPYEMDEILSQILGGRS